MPVMREEDVRAAVRSIAAEFADREVRSAGAGQCNDAWWVGDDHVFRFARNEEASRALDVEWEVLPRLAEAVDLSIPVPVFRGRIPTTGQLVLGHRAVKGTPLSIEAWRALPVVRKESIARELGRFLAQLHAYPLSSIRSPLPEAYHHPVFWNRERIAETVFPRLQPTDVARCLAVADQLQLLEESDWVLVHADLYDQHILFDSHGDLTGVIDFGDLARGDPAVDLVPAVEDLGFDCATALAAAHPSPEPHECLRRAVALCLWGALEWSAEQLADGNEDEYGDVEINIRRVPELLAQWES